MNLLIKIQDIVLVVKRALIACLCLFVSYVCFASAIAKANANANFEFIPHQWITMPDGVKLSVNYWKPQATYPGEKFPTVLEVLPYRKDDMHFTSDYLIGAYFARNGIVFARVDIRGTGASEGVTPDREYSDQELNDIPLIIKQLAANPWSNGNVGMQGISWSAFNSIMTAMQRPAHLKGILVAHGSDDIYANDIHNIDGALHLDIFTIEIEVDNIFPQSPKYQIDKNYFTDRFEQKPWIFSYLHHQRDGKFWQHKRSLRGNFSTINVPVYAFASLLDGYRDFAVNMLRYGKSPIRVAIGPQNHAWPDGDPGPRYEWRKMAVDYWQQILNGKDNGFWKLPKLMVFMRDPVPPNMELTETPGSYWAEQWPFKQLSQLLFIPQLNGTLSTKTGRKGIQSLVYKPSTGKGLLNWWGEATPDMRRADEGTLTYDSDIISKDFYVLGNPAVILKVAADAPFAHWVARLEDINPDGSVSFVTGGLQNSAQLDSRSEPKAIPVGKFVMLKFPMHFTTWRFAQGHRIRLTVANAQFPMIWPTPQAMTTKMMVGDGSSKVMLPVVNLNTKLSPKLPVVEADSPVPKAKYLKREFLTPFVVTQDRKGNIKASAKESCKMVVNGNIISASYKVFYQVNDLNPANAIYIGEGEDNLHVPTDNRRVKVQSTVRVQSDSKYFHTSVIRKVFENGKLLRTRSWKESIPRDFE